MLRDFLLAPGRYLCRKFSGNKKKARFVARQVERGPVVLLSFISWLAVAVFTCVLVFLFASPPTPTYNEPKTTEAAQTEVTTTGQPQGQPTAAQGNTATTETGSESQSTPATQGVQIAPSTATVVGPTQTVVEQSLTPAEDQSIVQGGSEAWLVIVESIPKNKRTEAEQSQARYKRKGVTLELLDTDAYPLLKSGMWTLATGPYETKKEAEAAATIIKPKVRDLMIRRGL